MGYLAHAGSIEQRAIRNAMVAGTAMASFCVEELSLDGLRDLCAERIQKRIDEIHDLIRVERVTL